MEYVAPVVDGRQLLGVATKHVLDETVEKVDGSLPITRIVTPHSVIVDTHESLEDISFLFSLAIQIDMLIRKQ